MSQDQRDRLKYLRQLYSIRFLAVEYRPKPIIINDDLLKSIMRYIHDKLDPNGVADISVMAISQHLKLSQDILSSLLAYLEKLRFLQKIPVPGWTDRRLYHLPPPYDADRTGITLPHDQVALENIADM